MNTYEWNTAKNAFVQVDDPIDSQEGANYHECISKAGYRAEIASDEINGNGASVTLYVTEDKNKPEFYIDIMGQNSGIANLVARDFPSLVETLRQIGPLLTLTHLDQFYTARVSDQIDREERARAKQR